MFGAPSSTENSNPFVNLHKKVIKRWDQLKCITDVIDKAFDGSDVAALWSESMDRGYELIKIDWVECDSFNAKFDVLK